jgi:LDH2 family malate/lactate/ureidoglycolate dehydrogenase
MENWRKYTLKEVEKPIETYGDLRSQLQAAIKSKKRKALKGFGIGLVFDALGGQVFKDTATFIKTMYKLPDDKKTGTVLDVFLNVNDDVSAIIDDRLENAFLQQFMNIIQSKPNDEKIKTSITQELQNWVAQRHNSNTVTKVK